MAFFQSFMKKVFEKKMGEFLRVEEGNYQCSASSVRLRQAEIKEEVFDELHLPITLRGGFIEEMSVTFPGMFGSGSAQVVIKNVFLVFGPHSTDWSWDHVYQCKSRLIDLVMKIYELKPRKKKKAGGGAAKGGYFADLQKRMISDMKRTFLSMLKVHISNIHFRYEDSITQSMPLACGFKIGYIGVSSKEETDDRRTTGEWKHWRERYANPEFCQAIACRRISAYWDLGQKAAAFALGPIAGQDVRRNFVRLNLRETFSACVVEKVLELFPPQHKRRKYLQGPVFRERLDFHRYVVFPASLRAEVTGNEASEATRAQKAPMKDLDVVVDPLEAAVDSEQVRSMNQLLVFVQEFDRKDKLLRTRPHEPISKYLDSTTPRSSNERSEVAVSQSGPDRSSYLSGSQRLGGVAKRISGAARQTNGQRKRSEEGPDAAARKALVRAWWHHAFQGVRYLCKIPRSPVSKQELLERTHLRESYISLCMAIEEAQERERAEPDAPRISDGLREKIQNMQMRLAPRDILEWRMMARERRGEHLGKLEEEAKEELEQQAAEKPPPNMPSTIQARVHFVALKAHFLGVADNVWNDIAGPLGDNVRPAPSSPLSKTPSTSSNSNRRRPRMTRQLVVKGQVLDVRIEVVQKGRSGHRVARWLELGVGSVSAANCNVEGPEHPARQILSILPIEQLSTSGGPSVCAFIGVGSLQCLDRNLEPGDVPLGAVLQPWEGLANHLREFPQEDTPEQIKRLGFLKDYKDELGKLMTFVFVRVGQVRALDYTPFRRRVLHFMTRGRGSQTTDLVRRPSPLALNRELLVKMQRKVEKLTGKSDMLGIVEGVVDGVRGRLVDHYNAQHVLCKEVSLAPMTWKALRNGKPQAFHLQFHQLQSPGERQMQSLQMPSLMAPQGDSWGLLPWKVSMLLLPKADFNMGLNITAEPAQPPVAVTETEKSQPTIADPVAVVLEGANFLKWGRNGKPKKRFVYYDEDLEAIVWKNEETDKQLIGAIPLSKIQDVCTGLQTPVLQRVRSSKLCADRVLSIVAAERTLDLQAETVDQQQRWVAGLKARYKQHIQQQDLEGDTAVKLPKALERRIKVYPDRFRSDRCTLKSTYKKLQAVSALGKSLLTSSQALSAQGS